MGEAVGLNRCPHTVEVVPPVHAEVLGDRHRQHPAHLQGGLYELAVVPIRRGHHDREGTPAPSVRRLRLVPLFARSVGLGPVASPPGRALVMAPFIDGRVHWIPTVSS
jgi:hypothetical protein